MPADLAARITTEVSLSTIGIGAGADTDAQVLVVNDLIGLTAKPPRFSKNFLESAGSIPAAIQQFANDVKSGNFPSAEHIF